MKKQVILVVDDEPTNFEVIESLLSDDRYELYYANNGAEALSNLDSYNPDVILLDLMMPDMDGWEVCKRLRLVRKWRSIPIIMVTAAAGKSILAQCLDSGADDFINKPVDALELRARINSMVRSKQQFDRIESLSKLQQHNIALLQNNLGELVGDLAIGFINELNVPLNNIQEHIEELRDNLGKFNENQIDSLLDLVSKSTATIQKNTYKFWTYLDFAAEKKQFNSDESCNIKQIINQISIVQAQWLNREQDLIIDLERANVAVTAKHCELIAKELLDNAFICSEPGTQISLCGRSIDRSFHLWIRDGHSDDAFDRPLASNDTEQPELGLGLKVVKKIVDMHHGSFVMKNHARHQTTIYLTLPLA